MTELKITITAEDDRAAKRLLFSLFEMMPPTFEQDFALRAAGYSIAKEYGGGVCEVTRHETRHCPQCHKDWTVEPGAGSSNLCVTCWNIAIGTPATPRVQLERAEAAADAERGRE